MYPPPFLCALIRGEVSLKIPPLQLVLCFYM